MRFVFRHTPFGGPQSGQAVEASECAGEQDRFWEYHDVLFENRALGVQGAFNDTNLNRYAVNLGLDSSAFSTCLNSNRYARLVEEGLDSADALGVESVPTIYINGQSLVGLRDYEDYRNIIEEELAAAR